MQGGQAALVGALRREEAASRSIKRLESELEAIKDVLKARDMDAQRTKMIIRLKEDKIARLQACTACPFHDLSYTITKSVTDTHDLGTFQK